jgi:hypothetical protein
VTERPILYEYFRRSADSLMARYRQTGVAEADANLGAAREILLRGFLDKVVPPHLSVETGEVWDTEGRKTGQLDVVLVRDDAPRLPLGNGNGVSAFIAEGVYAVVEVKSNLTTEKLEDSLSKLRKVAQLKVLPSETFYVGNPLDRPIRAVFGFEGATFGTLGQTLSTPANIGIADIVTVLDRGTWLRMSLARTVGFQVEKDAPNDQYAPFDGRPLALGMFYFSLTAKAASFSGRSIPFGAYFNPLNKWRD